MQSTIFFNTPLNDAHSRSLSPLTTPYPRFQTKSAFTRAVRSGHHSYPYASVQEATKRRKGGSDPLLGEDGDQEDAGEEEEQDEEDVTKDKMIKVGGGDGEVDNKGIKGCSGMKRYYGGLVCTDRLCEGC